MTKTENLPPIYFYLPQADWREDMPDNTDNYWEGFSLGIYAWTLQTYLNLKADGFPCTLIGSMPDAGIVLGHRDSFKYELRPTSNVLMICLKADQAAHPYAQMHVVQNPQEVNQLENSHYIPHWSQPGLIPRDRNRSDRFENIAYFGISYNLAEELKEPSWSETLHKMGLTWNIIPRSQWHDYQDIDAIVAVRNFQPTETYSWKPATKLYNAWHAGIPIILGKESAFRAERRSKLDYIEVTSLDETIAAIQTLKENPTLRQDMTNNGDRRAAEIGIESTRSAWKTFLINEATPAYQQWLESSHWSKWLYIQQHFFSIKAKALQRRLQNQKS